MIGRWKKGGERYTAAQRTELERFKEPPGWFRGARVSKR